MKGGSLRRLAFLGINSLFETYEKKQLFMCYIII